MFVDRIKIVGPLIKMQSFPMSITLPMTSITFFYSMVTFSACLFGKEHLNTFWHVVLLAKILHEDQPNTQDQSTSSVG